MKVLCDAIHASLWESLRLLIEVRFGWELYRPIGMEWYDSGIWNFERARLGDQVALQFLRPWDSDDVVATEERHEMRDWPATSHTIRADSTHPGQRIRLLTMDQAADLKPDLVIATLAENEQGLWKWAKDHGAHYGIQVGNQGAPNMWPIAEFALLSVTTPGFTPWKPYVTYHQEFSLQDFNDDAGRGGMQSNEVMTRVQCFSQTPIYRDFKQTAEQVPEGKFRWYGHCEPRDELFGGDNPTTIGVAAEMHAARVAHHAKHWSDGYGHVIHNWFAIGRPVLATVDYYRDKLAGPLFTAANSYNLDRMGVGDVAGIVRRLIHDDDWYLRMCEASAARFREVVDFASEAEQIKIMLDNVLSDRLVAA